MIRREAGTERDLSPSAKLKVCVALAFAKYNGWARERAKAHAMVTANATAEGKATAGGKGRPLPLGSAARATVFQALETWTRPPLWRLESAPWVLTGTQGDAGLHMGMIKMDVKVRVVSNPFREDHDPSPIGAVGLAPGQGLASGQGLAPGQGPSSTVAAATAAISAVDVNRVRDKSMDDIWTINVIGKESVTRHIPSQCTLSMHYTTPIHP